MHKYSVAVDFRQDLRREDLNNVVNAAIVAGVPVGVNLVASCLLRK